MKSGKLKVISDGKGQHTVSLLLDDGEEMMVRGVTFASIAVRPGELAVLRVNSVEFASDILDADVSKKPRREG